MDRPCLTQPPPKSCWAAQTLNFKEEWARRYEMVCVSQGMNSNRAQTAGFNSYAILPWVRPSLAARPPPGGLVNTQMDKAPITHHGPCPELPTTRSGARA